MRQSNRKPKILERDVTRGIREYLKFRRIFHWKVWQGLGSTKGVPDIVGIWGGRFVGIEVKKPGGKLSDAQKAFGEAIQREGGIFIVAYSVQDIADGLPDRGRR